MGARVSPGGSRFAMRGALVALASALVPPLASVARGDETAAGKGTTAIAAPAHVSTPELDSGDWLLKRKHTIAEFELGVMALPTAPISAGQQGGNLPIGTIGHGDATASVGMHLLFRGGPNWAIGAGALFAPRPTSDNNYGVANGPPRSHARSYLSLGGEGRYIPIHFKTVEAWVGVSVGAVIVADRFDTTTAPVPSDLGTSEVTVRTEGFSVGLQTGGEWAFAERLIIGFALRLNRWVLPSQSECTPIGDCSTLVGSVTELELGLRFGYLIPL
jgi:hypothetical protein